MTDLMGDYVRKQKAEKLVKEHEVKPRPTEAQRVEAMMLMAALGGSPTRAAEICTAKGFPITRDCLSRWKNTERVEQYDEIRQRYQEEIDQLAIRNMREAVADSIYAMQRAVELQHKKMDEGKEYDPSKAAANMARVVSTGIDKLHLMLGRPTSINETRSAEEIVQALDAVGVRVELGPPS